MRNEELPFARLDKALSSCKIALVSTGGVFSFTDSAFAIAGRDDVDESYREIPRDTAPQDLRVAHEHFNQSYCTEDINVIFPVQRLKVLAEQGCIGEVAATNYSITGYIPRPGQLFDSAKAIARPVNVGAGSGRGATGPGLTHLPQSGGLVARQVEQAGIPTVTLNLIPEIVSIVGIPRAFCVPHAFGSPVGAPNDVPQQVKVLRAALSILVFADWPGSLEYLGAQGR